MIIPVTLLVVVYHASQGLREWTERPCVLIVLLSCLHIILKLSPANFANFWLVSLLLLFLLSVVESVANSLSSASSFARLLQELSEK